MKRFITLAFILVTALGMAAFWQWKHTATPLAPSSRPLVAIIQTIEHAALNEARRGVMEGLAQENFIDKQTADITYETAQGNAALALQIAQKFVGQKAQVIICIGTTAAQAAVQATQGVEGISVVFTSVSDPLGARLLTNLEKPEGHVTGITDFVEPVKHFEMFHKIVRPLKRLGIIYNPGEANSVTAVTKMEAAAPQFGMELVLAPATKTADVSAAAQSIIDKVDAIFINNDNTALAAFDAITRIGNEHSKPVFVSDVEIIDKGAIAALGPNQYALGVQTAKLAATLLRGEKPVALLPLQWPQQVELKLNMDVATKLEVEFTQDLLSQSERMN
jgi:putative ABC transport system substrate-binding protein